MRLAARGTRDLDGGEEPVMERAERAALRRRARRIHAQAIGLTVGGAALAIGLRMLLERFR